MWELQYGEDGQPAVDTVDFDYSDYLELLDMVQERHPECQHLTPVKSPPDGIEKIGYVVMRDWDDPQDPPPIRAFLIAGRIPGTNQFRVWISPNP
jgi:hypothetical protein